MARPVDWKKARGLNDNPLFVAMPCVYELTLDTAGKKLAFGNFTRSVQIRPVGADVYVGLTEAGNDATNRFLVPDGEVFAEQFQTANLYLRAASGTATCYVWAVLDDTPVPSDFGDIATANGFDGGDTATAVEDLS